MESSATFPAPAADSPLAGQTVIVTGAGSGLGRATALLLARNGAKVVLTGRRPAPLERTMEQICAAGGTAFARCLDVTQPAAVRSLVDWVVGTVGVPDILVNNAGAASKVKNILWIDQDDWETTVAINLTAVYAMVKAVLPAMLGAGRGTIVTISSLAAERPNLLGGAPYGAAKAAARNLMAYVRNTFRHQGIRAATILPGEMDTPILDDRPVSPSAALRARMMAPEDVARIVLLCCCLPGRTMIEDVVVAPTVLRDQSADLEFSRAIGRP